METQITMVGQGKRLAIVPLGALLADPVFEADDPRLVKLGKKKASNSASARRDGFSRLP
jgi:hypothetical protein